MPPSKRASDNQNPPPKLAAPQFLLWGSFFWNVVGHISNIDFLMSIQAHSLREAFELFFDYGSWILPVIGVAWWVAVAKEKMPRPSWVQTVWAIAIVSFMWGGLLVLNITSAVPRTITSWSTDRRLGGCLAGLDVSNIQRFKNKYDVAVVCGIQSPNIDRMTDKGVSISLNFNIPPNSFEILAQFSNEMNKSILSGSVVTMWFMTILVPKGTDMSIIHNLMDVRKYNGKILEAGYFE
jgi:hypothetical protein